MLLAVYAGVSVSMSTFVRMQVQLAELPKIARALVGELPRGAVAVHVVAHMLLLLNTGASVRVS
eukprot:13111980-Alexandrium_andersonii.AAC.1